MKKGIRNKRPDFNERLIQYAVESDLLLRCNSHTGSIYRSTRDIARAHAVVEAAWKRGEISSDLENAIGQVSKLVEKAPASCSHPECWSGS